MSVSASLWVVLGSAAGGLARYWMGIGVAALTGPGFPWGTLLINAVGSFIIGVFGAALGGRGLFGPMVDGAMIDGDGRLGGFVDLRAFVMVGLCGGFTTFSAYSLQSLELLQAGRHGPAFAYMTGSVLACLAAVWAGWVLGAGTWTAAQG